MIRHYIFLASVALGITFGPIIIHAQSRADSLRQTLKDAQGKERIEILLDLGGYTRQTDPEKAIDEEQEAEVLHQLGLFYYGQEKYSQALDYYFKSLRIREAKEDKNGAAATLYYIGVIYGEREEYEKAQSFYKQSYDRGQEIDDYRQMSMAASEMGIIYQNLDSLGQALKYYNLAMDAAKKLNSSHAEATILLYLSLIHI